MCENASIPLNDSGLSAPSANSVKAYRSVDYSCTNSSLVMDNHGKKYSIVCNADGTFATPDWPTCREAANCTGDIPAPPPSSKLENSTSNLADLLEFDDAIFKCSDSSHVVGKLYKTIIDLDFIVLICMCLYTNNVMRSPFLFRRLFGQ